MSITMPQTPDSRDRRAYHSEEILSSQPTTSVATESDKGDSNSVSNDVGDDASDRSCWDCAHGASLSA